ncbi:cupredoxin domain-containing protein [Candidatus Peregrinibacteria bacterium]|nr:cupredoxin domain-containing protein [Candidatus Peregrinibacteria bacterium]MBI5733128.1 cupredoxin domain-containing protein [Candidatus Jorgensenbacteria bacterium]
MNKYIWLIIVGVVIIGGGIIYSVFLRPQASDPVTTGEVREVTVIARKDRWAFEPEEIEARRGDKIVMTVINEDDYDHGIAIDAFGVSQRMAANSTIKIEFVVTQEGDFPFYCSVPCGEGEVDGKKRDHFDMVGKIHVRSMVSETQ